MRKIRFIFQKEHSESLDLNQWSRILKEAYSLGFNYFYLKAVDAIGNKKLEEFLEIISRLNFLVELEDDQSWSEKRKAALLNSNINLFWLTFYGLTPKTHNNLKNKNDFQIILEKFNFLRSKNLPVGFRLVLSKNSFDEIFSLLSFLKTLEYLPQRMIIEEISPVEGNFFKKELLVSPEQLKLYLPYLRRYVLGFPNKINPNVKIYSNYQNSEHYPFISGEEIIIEGNGDIRSFPLFSSQAVGNVFSDSFPEIYKNLIEDLNRLTLESVEKGRFLNWSAVLSDCPELNLNYQDIERVILPNAFNLMTTQKCNFRCDFCEFECKPEDKEAIDIKDFEKLLKEGKQLGIKQLFFDGGEPLVYSDIRKAFKIARDLGYEVTVFTNGWYFKDFLEDFKENNIKKFIFGLYGASAKTHDVIVNKEGAFERCISAVRSSKAMGFFTGIHTVLHPLSFSELDRFFDLTERLRVDYIMVSPIIPVGRAKDNRNLILGEEEKAEIQKIYQRHNNFLSKITFSGYQPYAGRNSHCKYLERSGPLSPHWDGSIGLCSMTPLLKLPFLKIKNYSLIDCLIFMNKINELFQADRNREFPYWHPELEEAYNCLYCYEKLSKEIGKYINFNHKNFLK